MMAQPDSFVTSQAVLLSLLSCCEEEDRGNEIHLWDIRILAGYLYASAQAYMALCVQGLGIISE